MSAIGFLGSRVHLPRAPEDGVEHEQQLALRTAGPGRGAERRAPRLDHRRGVMSSMRFGAEPREQVRLDDRAVVAQRRRLAAALVGDVAQVLGGRVGERRSGSNHARQRSTTGLVGYVARPRLGSPLREVARRRPPPLSPGGPDLRLDLPPVGQPVLRVPDRARAPDRLGRRVRSALSTPPSCRILCRSWDTLGTPSTGVERSRPWKSPALPGFCRRCT